MTVEDLGSLNEIGEMHRLVLRQGTATRKLVYTFLAGKGLNLSVQGRIYLSLLVFLFF